MPAIAKLTNRAKMHRFTQYAILVAGFLLLIAIGWFSGFIPFILDCLAFLLQVALILALLPIATWIIAFINLCMPKR